MAPGDQKESGRPAVDGCASPLRIQKERPFFPTFGDEERLSFFPEPKGFGLADGWPEGGAPGGRGAEEVIDGRLASCLEKHRTTGCKQDSCERAAHGPFASTAPLGGGGKERPLREGSGAQGPRDRPALERSEGRGP
jgi:hypothetical protein